MTTAAVSTTKTLEVAGIGPVELTVEERGDGQPFLVLHGGAGPQSVAAFAELLAEKDRNRVLTPTHPGFGGTPRPRPVAQRGRARRPLPWSARRPQTRGRDGHRELGRWLDRSRDGPPGLTADEPPGAPRCGGYRTGGPPDRRRLRPLRAGDPSTLVPRPDALPGRSRHHPRCAEGNHGGQWRGLGRLCRLSGDGRPDAFRPPQRHFNPYSGAVGRERSDRPARLRPGLRRGHSPGALRGAVGHRAHAPDGDSRPRAAKRSED